MPKTTNAAPGRLSSRFWRLLGASTERDQRRSLAEVSTSSEFDEKAAGLDDDQLKKAAGLLRLDDLAESDDIPQFLAIAREAAERSTDLRPFDVQLLGALRMLAGDVIEMATGEGKTLAGAIAAAGYALAGRRVHVLTINDYLAHRDAEWMSPLLEALGFSDVYDYADSKTAWMGEGLPVEGTLPSSERAGAIARLLPTCSLDHTVGEVRNVMRRCSGSSRVEIARAMSPRLSACIRCGLRPT